PASADLRAGPGHPGRPGFPAAPRPDAARVLPGRLPAPRLPAAPERVHRQAGHAGADRTGGRGAVRKRLDVAFRRESRPMTVLDDTRVGNLEALCEAIVP